MNFADEAERLRSERLAKEKQESDRQAKEKEEAAAKARQAADLTRRKLDEVLPLLKQFHGRKIRDGHVTLEADIKGAPRPAACLVAGSVGSSVAGEYKPGALIVTIEYDPEKAKYKLLRHPNPPRVAGEFSPVGDYASAEDVMKAVAVEVSKL
jgi:hypothetical protein